MANWTPSQIDTALWLDADDAGTITTDGNGNVQQWDDKSGNGRHATQSNTGNRPAFNATESRLAFDDANSEHLELAGQPFAGTTPRTVIAVVQSNDPNADSGGGFYGAANSQEEGENYDLSHEHDGVWVRVFGNAQFTPNPSHDVDNILAIQWESGDSSNTKVWHDGAQLSYESGNDQPIDTASGTSHIGHTPAQSNQYFNGLLYEMVIVAAPLSASDRQKLEGYLAHKWGLENRLPSGHPYKSSPPQVFSLSGSVEGETEGSAIAATIRVYRQSDGSFQGEQALDGTKAGYSIIVNTDEPYTVVAIPPDGSDLPAQVLHDVTPVE